MVGQTIYKVVNYKAVNQKFVCDGRMVSRQGFIQVIKTESIDAKG